ncbi:MAG: hypothetical protein ACXABY_30450 [Candidatus Thorarchaeota archaeon]
MGPFASAIFLAMFIGGVLLLLILNFNGILNSTGRRIKRAQARQWTLSEFLNLRSIPSPSKSYLFREQSVFSVGHRFNGRFDNAVLHWEEAPILDAIIERKFPTSYLPEKPRDEDIFQAGLYALALMESGVACSSAKLVLIYCLQSKARQCIGREGTDCISCGEGSVFIRKFSQKSVLRALDRLDEVWYRGRKPKASPDRWKCRGCPHGQNRTCSHSAA